MPGRLRHAPPSAPRAPVVRVNEGNDILLHVDPIGCTAHGICAELLPELIQLDDWGYPIIAEGPIPADLHALAKRAVTACPALALQLAPVRVPTVARSGGRTG